MSGKLFRCDYCDSTMTGKANYDQHIEGKKHLKKLKALGSIALTKTATPTVPPTANAAISAAGYGGKFVKSGYGDGEEMPAGQFKTPTHPVLNNTNMDSCIESATKPLEQQTPADILGTCNTDPVMNAVKANMLGKLPLKKPAYDRRCDLCGIDYTSHSHELQHLAGKKHLKKVESQQVIENSATFFCGFCNLRVNSVEQMEQHRAGTAHLKKISQARKTQQEGASAAKKKFVPSSDELEMPPPTTTLPDLKPLTYDK